MTTPTDKDWLDETIELIRRGMQYEMGERYPALESRLSRDEAKAAILKEIRPTQRDRPNHW